MGSEANQNAMNPPESSSPDLRNLITKIKSSMVSIDPQNVTTKTLLDSEQRLKNQNANLIKMTQVLEKENKKMSDLLKKKEKRIEILKMENEELEDEVKEMVEENLGLKKELEEYKKVYDECLKKVRVYKKRFSDFDVRVSGLEKLGKELVESPGFSDKGKDRVLGCVAETSIQQMSSGKEKSKPRIDEKFPTTIQIDEDDEGGLKHVPSSKRYQGSSEIDREHDSDDERYISILINKKPVTKEIRSECDNDHANKIPTGTTTTMPKIQTGIQKITSHSASPFLDSDSDEEKIKETYETIVDEQKERRESAVTRIECVDLSVTESSKKQISGEKEESQERTNKRSPNIIQIDDAEDKDENDQKDVSALKRKRGLSNVKVENDSDDERGILIFRRKPASKELQSEYTNDHVNIIPTGGQPLTSHFASPIYVSGSNGVKVEEGSAIEKHTERWESEAEMLIEFSKNDELCMNAVCALHRQNIYVGAYLLPRISRLAEWLIDGDSERKLKKTPSQLKSAELDQCRMIALTYSAELYKVYQQNADRFFPPRN